ncbi:aspartate aminotransferase family protein [Agrobacterium tumefaciens]|uniref:aspartate aminotransferase family protein n=1 Tax=Agrobacterium tumefaciens TaxID=358 RepID=UPI001CBBC901|nr:aspartate aminotransferase family protein [Agrobacterium tumefaciens]
MIKPLMINAFDPDAVDGLDNETIRLIERRKQVLGPSYKLFYERPVHAVSAEGVWITDGQGQRYLDVYNNVPSVGHSHPRVVEAVSRQMAVLNTHTRYLNDVVLSYAEKLLGHFPSELSNVMFTCTGSESSDLALRIAKTHTGGAGIVVTENAYHGLTEQIARMSPSLGVGVPLWPNVRTVPAPDTYRLGPENVAEVFSTSIKEAFEDLSRHGFKPAAFVADMVFSSDGIFADPAGFLKPALDAVHAAGALFIADEVQPGFGRTGQMWGFARHGIVPDLVLMGKPMGNGLPIGGVVARPEVLGEFAATARYFNTFGGNPVCCAAAHATLSVIEDEGLAENSLNVGNYLQRGLRERTAGLAAVGDIRGAGLFVGLDFVKDSRTREPDGDLGLFVVNALRDRNILISASGVEGNVLKIRPPLPFATEHADIFLDAFEHVIRSTEFQRKAAVQ